ncbi:hypothetical protein D3C87_2155430 [compost metagenome]
MDIGTDFVMHRMALAIGRTSQRDQDEIMPGLLKPEQFLRNEGFRKARVSFQNHGNLAVCWQCFSSIS